MLGNVFDHLGASHPATASATASTAAPKRHSFTASASNTAPTALNTGEVSEAGDVYDYIHQILQEIEAESNDDEEDANEDEDRLGLDEYIPMLCNPAIEQSPTGQSVVSPLVKIFQLSDLYLQARIRKDVHASRAPNTYLFNLQSYVLDSVYHTQGSDSLVDQAASNPSGRASIYNLYIPPSHGLASASKMFAVVSKIKVFNLFCLDVTKVTAVATTRFHNRDAIYCLVLSGRYAPVLIRFLFVCRNLRLTSPRWSIRRIRMIIISYHHPITDRTPAHQVLFTIQRIRIGPVKSL